jgi:hypothetical protein
MSELPPLTPEEIRQKIQKQQNISDSLSSSYYNSSETQETQYSPSSPSSPSLRPLLDKVINYIIEQINEDVTTVNNEEKNLTPMFFKNLYSNKLNYGINNYNKFSTKQYETLYNLLLKDTNYNRFIGINAENENKKIEIKLFIIDVVNEMLKIYYNFLTDIKNVNITTQTIENFINYHRKYKEENTPKPTPLFNSIDYLYLNNAYSNNPNENQQNKYIKGQITIDNPENFNFEGQLRDFEIQDGEYFSKKLHNFNTVTNKFIGYTRGFVQKKINSFKENINNDTNANYSENNNKLREKVKNGYTNNISLLKNIFTLLLENTVNTKVNNYNGNTIAKTDDNTHLQNNLKFHVFLSYIVNLNKYIIYLSMLQKRDYDSKIDKIILLIKDPGLPNSGKFLNFIVSMTSIKRNPYSMSDAVTEIINNSSKISFSFSGIGMVMGSIFKSMGNQFALSFANSGGKKTRRRQKRMTKVNAKAKAKRRIRKSRKMDREIKMISR